MKPWGKPLHSCIQKGLDQVPGKKPYKKLPQALLILLLSISGGIGLRQDAFAQVNTDPTSPGNPQRDVTQGTRVLDSYSESIAKYRQAQQELLHGAENIVFSQDRSANDLKRSYPFLSGSLNGVNAVRLAASPGNGIGVNLLFVYKQGPLLPDRTYYCGHDGCALDVYVDDGTGYKQALGAHYTGTGLHVSRANGQVEFFIEIPRTSYRTGGQNEWVLKGNSFIEHHEPFPPDCCGPRLRNAQAQTVGKPQPAEAPPAPIPPPPPPADERPPAPKEISLGQARDVVVANLGQPEKIAKIATREIYFYKDFKVIFVNGKVTDVQ